MYTLVSSLSDVIHSVDDVHDIVKIVCYETNEDFRKKTCETVAAELKAPGDMMRIGEWIIRFDDGWTVVNNIKRNYRRGFITLDEATEQIVRCYKHGFIDDKTMRELVAGEVSKL